MTTLSTIGAQTKLALQEGNNWSDVVRASMRDQHEDALPSVKSPVAKPVTLSETDEVALAEFTKKLGEVVWPTGRRALKQPELRKLIDLLATTKNLIKVFKKVEAAEKTVFFNHFDVCAEKDEDNPANLATSPRHKEGFYALEDKTNGTVPECDFKVTREVSSASVALSAELLLDLVMSGELPRETYLKMTAPTRVVSEEGVMQQIKLNPGLIPTLKKATVVTREANVSLNLRKSD